MKPQIDTVTKSQEVVAKKSMPLRVAEILRSRFGSAFFGFSHQGQRNLYQQFGYPRELLTQDLYGMYLRNDIAHRIIKAFPQATWRDAPLIRDEAGSSPNKEDKDYSPFVEAVDELFETNKVISCLERADRLASIGQYGVMVIGVKDGQPLDTPLESKQAQLMYLQGYMQNFITINEFDVDEKSDRFGKPKFYTVRNGSFGAQQTSVTKSLRVHHSRVIHIAEFLDQDEVFGTPRLEAVFNRLMDVEKVVGGASESFWLNASRGVALTADADSNIDMDSLKDMKEQLEEFDNQLRRNLALQGVTAQQLATAIADPEPILDQLLSLIAGTIGMPKRILTGSEMGQLASGQDENNWADRTNERRRSFAGPYLLRPFITKMIETGNLPEPEGKFWVDWPDSAASPSRQAELGNVRTTMLRNYLMTPGAEIVVPVAEFRQDFMGVPAVSEYEEGDIEQEIEALTTPAPIGEQSPLPEDDGEVQSQFNRLKVNREPRPLYVYRSIENAKDIIDHFKSQGVKTTLRPEDLHVTVMYSKTPVEWMKASAPWSYGDAKDVKDGVLRVAPGGPRDVDLFGAVGNKCLVLLFNNSELTWRHQVLLELGCSYGFKHYQPHITITYDVDDIDLSELEPYTGEIVLGPEIFEEIDDDWKDGLVENSLRFRVSRRLSNFRKRCKTFSAKGKKPKAKKKAKKR